MIVPLFVAIPLGLAFLIPLLSKLWRRSGDVLANCGTAALLVLSLYSIRLISGSPLVYEMGGWRPPFGIALVLDGLSLLVLVCVSVVSFACSVYSVSYMSKFTSKWKFYTLFMLMITGLNGVTITGDIFNMYVFFEIAAIASYALVAFGTEHEELEAAFKYMVLGSVASMAILFSIALLYGKLGTLNLADLSRKIAEAGDLRLLAFGGALLLTGFAVKAALVPFHSWLPDAHPSAPAPISAMLSGVFIKVLGVYAMSRIFFNVFGVKPVHLNLLLFFGVVSLVVAALLALRQSDIKRLLAYSSISQIGYIALGLGSGSPLGIMGALFHILSHSTGKALLFLTSGSLVYSAGTRNLEDMGGLEERMPVTATSFTVGALSIAGVPPFHGFFSKLFIIMGLWQAQRYTLAVAAIIMSVLTLAYMLKVEKHAFFGTIKEHMREVRESPPAMLISLIFLAALCIGIGVFFPWVIKVFIEPARDVLLKGIEYADTVLGS
jgi:multicomponent Na+:H+ antiporter subunit D